MNPQRWKLFEEEVLPYLDALYGFSLLLTGRVDEAEDLVQETFLRALRFFHQYEPGSNCKAWLFTITKHIFLNQAPLRARTVLCPDPYPDEEGEHRGPWHDFVTHVRGSMSGRDEIFAKDIEKALGLLPESFRLVVVLKDVEGFSYRDCSVTGVPDRGRSCPGFHEGGIFCENSCGITRWLALRGYNETREHIPGAPIAMQDCEAILRLMHANLHEELTTREAEDH